MNNFEIILPKNLAESWNTFCSQNFKENYPNKYISTRNEYLELSHYGRIILPYYIHEIENEFIIYNRNYSPLGCLMNAHEFKVDEKYFKKFPMSYLEGKNSKFIFDFYNDACIPWENQKNWDNYFNSISFLLKKINYGILNIEKDDLYRLSKRKIRSYHLIKSESFIDEKVITVNMNA